MTNKVVVIFSILIIFIFSLGIFYFAINVSDDLQKGSYEADAQFRSFLANMNYEISNSPYLSPDYLEKLRDLIKQNEYIAAVTIKSESNTYFAYPLSSKYISASSASPEIYVTSPALVVRSTDIPYNDTTDTEVQAAIYLIKPSKVFDYALYSFYFIAGGTFLALLVLFFSRKTKKTSKAIVTTEENIIQTEKSVEDSDKPEQEPAAKIRKPANPIQQKESVKTIDPMGLFSPATGISWESYLETRLDAELVRAASSEQEFSIINIKVENLPHNHPCAKEIASILIETFKFRDLLFEFSDDSYICVLPNVDLNKTLSISESLYQELKQVISSFGLVNQLVFGISTRAMRLISGLRLVKESIEAVNKALEEPELPIVAFRVNAERYKQFLTEELEKANKAGVAY
ncbi:MAG: hypothetical protein IKZ86_09820 [Spirochaetaceae bacterium]|nr:hypothetical protein [Spirochaetaceae bacterium]